MSGLQLPDAAPRVLMLCPQFHPIVGGYERAAQRLSAELVRQGCGVTVLTEQRQSEWPQSEVLDGVIVQRVPCDFKRGRHILSSLRNHARWLWRHGREFQVWHVHQYGVHASLFLLLALLLRRPVALKLTNTGTDGLAATLTRSRLQSLQRWAHRRVSACIAVSAEAAAEALAFGIPQDRVVEIPNGMDTQRFAPVGDDERLRLRLALGLDPQRHLALFVGRLATEKSPQTLLQAWALLRPRLTQPWTLVMVGDGPLRPEVEAQVQALGLQDDVHLAGESAQVPQWLGAADIFVLSSSNEGMANTLLEAMACGLASVVTQVSGMEQMVRQPQTGLVVPVGDARALAEALLSLHADPERRRQMGRRARALVMQRFAIERVASEHRRLYGRLLGRDRG